MRAVDKIRWRFNEWHEMHSLNPLDYVPQRIQLAVHVLRGRPIMYGMYVEGRFTAKLLRNTKIVNCTFIGKDLPKDAAFIEVTSTQWTK
jgi:hypothetical protein